LAPLNLPLAAWDGQPEMARVHGTFVQLSGELAAYGQTARLSLRNVPAGKPQFEFARAPVRYSSTQQKTQTEIPEIIFSGA